MMANVPSLADDARTKLIRSLEAAQARIQAGQGVDYDPKTFKKRLLRRYRSVRK